MQNNFIRNYEYLLGQSKASLHCDKALSIKRIVNVFALIKLNDFINIFIPWIFYFIIPVKKIVICSIIDMAETGRKIIFWIWHYLQQIL